MGRPLQDQHVPGFDPPPGRTLDKALAEIFTSRGLERLGGRSARGWSSRATLQRCPYLYQQTYVERAPRGGSSMALETGIAFHTFLAGHYQAMMASDFPLPPEVLRDELLASGCPPEPVMGAWRLYEGYACRYEEDYLAPLAIEQPGRYAAPGAAQVDTCRWDLIAQIEHAQPGLVPGTYIVEHKTSSQMTSTNLDAWKADGEIIGQVWIYLRGGYEEAWGPLRGVIMNVIGKQATPRFERMVIPPQVWQIDQHEGDLRSWDLLENLYRTTGLWPRSRANCVGRYGPCALFDHCADGTALERDDDDE